MADVAAEEEASATPHAALKKVRFRNYRPRDTALQAYALPPSAVPGVAEAVAEKLAQLRAQPAASETEGGGDDDELTLLAAPKRNWDLKRDLAPRIAKLEKRTQTALYDLLRERIQQQQQPSATSE